jgi:hypothetical protein
MRPVSFHYVAASAMLMSAASACATDWLQFGMDPQHNGTNTLENGYSTATGNTLAFPAVSMPSPIDVAPVFAAGVATPSGIKDLLFAMTQAGALLAIDASDGDILWSRQPSGAGTSTQSSPAIDTSRQYVYAYGLDGNVHKYTIGDGTEPTSDGWPQLITNKPDLDKVAAGLTIATAPNGHAYLYVVTDSYLDVGDFQGHLTTIDLGDSSQTVFNPQCSELTIHFVANGITSGGSQDDCTAIPSGRAGQKANSGIWGRPGAVFDSATDRVYIATGNGLFDPAGANGNGKYWGDTVLALNPDGTGAGLGLPLDSYTPQTYAALLETDADLGSTSPAILPVAALSLFPHLAMQGGKDGCVRLLNLDDLSGTSEAGHAGGELQAVALPGVVDHCGDGGNIGTFKSQAAVWVNPADGATWIFEAFSSGFVAYELVFDEAGHPSLSQKWATNDAGTSPVVANSTVYYVSGGAIRGLDATSGTTVWSTNAIGGIHWQSPIVVNGRLYVFDITSKLWVYALDGVFRGSFD